MKTASILILTAALGAMAAPAFAAQSDSEQPKVSYDAKSGKYCFASALTGSHIARRECRTKQEWAAQGVTISPATPKLASK